MARPRFGRKARIYYHTSSFSASTLIIVEHTKDISIGDEAAEMKATATDYEYNMVEQGGKDFSLEFEFLPEATDTTSFAAIRSAYDSQTDLYFAVVNDIKANASGSGITFVGRVMKFDAKYPEEGAAGASVVIKPCDPANPPTRASTPLA